MDERDLRHKLANLKAALNLVSRVAEDPHIPPDRRRMVEERQGQIEKEIRAIERQIPAGEEGGNG